MRQHLQSDGRVPKLVVLVHFPLARRLGTGRQHPFFPTRRTNGTHFCTIRPFPLACTMAVDDLERGTGLLLFDFRDFGYSNGVDFDCLFITCNANLQC